MAVEPSEDLSALVDGELDDGRMSFVVRRLTRDAEIKGRWERYHLISDALKGQLPQRMDRGFADGVMAAVAQEAQSQAESVPRRTPSAWRHTPAVGFALAASVALVSFLTLDWFVEVNTGPTALTNAPNPSFAVPGEDLEGRLSRYVVSHSYASSNGVNHVLPYVRAVGYQPVGQ
ncbi:MAG: sigma-E factor negative regulatory protein [Candidatus Competibacterales bacterium]